MSEWVLQERERVDALLGLSNLEFTEGQPDISPSELGALASWRFTSVDNHVQADVYILDDAEAIQNALADLLQKYPADTQGLPAVSNNGGIVFVVQTILDQPDMETKTQAFTVASALAGEEE